MLDCCHVLYSLPQETCKPALGATVVVKVRPQRGPTSPDCTDRPWHRIKLLACCTCVRAAACMSAGNASKGWIRLVGFGKAVARPHGPAGRRHLQLTDYGHWSGVFHWLVLRECQLQRGE